MTQTATIAQLKPGHEYPGGNINSRKDYPASDVSAMLASIQTFGVLQSLCVCSAPGSDGPPYYVAAGGRRRFAIETAIKQKKLPADFPIPIIVRTDFDGAMALAASIEENQQVLSPHPVKVFEQFAELQARGKTIEEIAKLFRMELRHAKGVLALGALSPKIRKAWLDEEIDADDAKAFTLAPDHKTQDEVFAKLKQSHELYAHSIRHAILGDNGSSQKFLAYVGRAAYESAGGGLQEDLFSEGKHLVVKDRALLNKLADEKFTGDLQALRDAGWGEVIPANDLPQDRWIWKNVPGGAKANADTRAKAVCCVNIDREGKLELEYLIRPTAAKGSGKAAKAGAGEKAKAKPSNTISNSLRQDLIAMAARATQDALKTLSGHNTVEGVLAGMIATQITPDRYNYMPSVVRDRLGFIRDQFDKKVMADALQKRFDAKRYFSSAPKTLVIKAITEAISPDQAKKLASGTKAAAWKFAIANIPKTWLPPELRTSHYDGPGAKTATVTKLKPKAKAPKVKAAKKKAA